MSMFTFSMLHFLFIFKHFGKRTIKNTCDILLKSHKLYLIGGVYFEKNLIFRFFSKLDACSFVTNVYDEGNFVSLVTDCSPHGTHVAGIATAFHPEVS